MLGSLQLGGRQAIRTRNRLAPESLHPDETVFFVHIPKCAGSSFRSVLKRWFSPDLMVLDTHRPQTFAEHFRAQAAPPRAIVGHFPFGLHDAVACRPYYLSLVRDPVDRFVSAYQHACDTETNALHAAAAALDLDKFYEHTLSDPQARRHTVGIQCQFLAGARSFAQARDVVDDHYRLVAPIEAFDDFLAMTATLLGKAAATAPRRNIRPIAAGLADAARRLEPRIRQEHKDDQLIYEHVVRRFAQTRRA